MKTMRVSVLFVATLITACGPITLETGVPGPSESSADARQTENTSQPVSEESENPQTETSAPHSKKDGSCLRESGRFKSADGGCKELKTGFVYSLWATDGGEGDELTFAEAKDYCDQLQAGGFKDWVLPTFAELSSLEGRDRGYSHFDFDTNKYFWTQTYESYQEVIYTSIYYGGSYSDKLDDRHFAVCVRNTPSSKAKGQKRDPGACLNEDDRFKSEGGGCKELKTGRVFSAPARDGDQADSLTFPAAKAYCDSLTEGGKNDWRMPTYDELYSLYGKDRGQAHINAPTDKYFWVNTFKAADKPYYSSIRYSGKYSDDLDDKHHVICVR